MVPSFTKSKKTLKTTFTKTSVIFKIILCSIIFSETTAVAVTLTSDGVSQTLVLPLSSNKSNLVFLRNIKHAPGTLWRLWGYHPCTFRALMYIYPCLFFKKNREYLPKERQICVRFSSSPHLTSSSLCRFFSSNCSRRVSSSSAERYRESCAFWNSIIWSNMALSWFKRD